MADGRIRQLRERRGWSQYRLAQESGVPRQTLNYLERHGHASLDVLVRLAEGLRVPLSEISAEDADRVRRALEGNYD